MSRNRFLAVLLLLVAGRPAQAHDTGFGHSRRTLFVAATANDLELEYRIRQNADEALIEAAQIDADGDGQITPVERDGHFAAVSRQLIEGLHLRTADGRDLQPALLRYELQNSLTQTFYFTIHTASEVILVEDRNFAHKPGQVRILTGRGIRAATTPAADLSHVDRLSFTITREKAAR